MTDVSLKNLSPIAEGVYLEGLAIDEKRGLIWYSDVVAGGVHAVSSDGRKVFCLNPERRWTGGIFLNDDGCILSSGAGGIKWNHPESGSSGWLINCIDGQPINGVNEMWSDGAGGIFFGTVDIENVALGQQTRETALYHLAKDQTLRQLVNAINFSNGFVYDEKRHSLYLSDSFNAVLTFDVDENLCLSNRRVLVDKKDCDGMVHDQEGCLWISGFASSGVICRVNFLGEMLAPIQTPEGATTQLRFGGDDNKDIYFTLVPIDGGASLKKGETPKGGSLLYKGRSNVAGVKAQLAEFSLR